MGYVFTTWGIELMTLAPTAKSLVQALVQDLFGAAVPK